MGNSRSLQPSHSRPTTTLHYISRATSQPRESVSDQLHHKPRVKKKNGYVTDIAHGLLFPDALEREGGWLTVHCVLCSALRVRECVTSRSCVLHSNTHAGCCSDELGESERCVALDSPFIRFEPVGRYGCF